MKRPFKPESAVMDMLDGPQTMLECEFNDFKRRLSDLMNQFVVQKFQMQERDNMGRFYYIVRFKSTRQANS